MAAFAWLCTKTGACSQKRSLQAPSDKIGEQRCCLLLALCAFYRSDARRSKGEGTVSLEFEIKRTQDAQWAWWLYAADNEMVAWASGTFVPPDGKV